MILWNRAVRWILWYSGSSQHVSITSFHHQFLSRMSAIGYVWSILNLKASGQDKGSWNNLGGLESNLHGLGANLGGLGANSTALDLIWAVLGANLAVLGPTWAISGPTCAIWGPTWAVWGQQRAAEPSEGGLHCQYHFHCACSFICFLFNILIYIIPICV